MRRAPIAVLLLATLAIPAASAPDPTRDVLWAALKTGVLAKRIADRTFPCLSVDLGDRDRPGSAVLRAPGEPTHIVVMPTDTTAGRQRRVCSKASPAPGRSPPLRRPISRAASP